MSIGYLVELIWGARNVLRGFKTINSMLMVLNVVAQPTDLIIEVPDGCFTNLSSGTILSNSSMRDSYQKAGLSGGTSFCRSTRRQR